MSEFEFFFSFYGLLLGLAMAELLSGFAGVVRFGRLRSVDPGTALLALTTAFLIMISWLAAWHYQRGVQPSLRTMAVPFLSGASYFVASCLVFPRDCERWPELRAYFLEHKRQVALFLLIPFLLSLATEIGSVLGHVRAGRWAHLLLYYLPFNGTVLASYLVLMFSRSYRLSVGALLATLAWFGLVSLPGY